eukprot:TRINITY_DN6643_c2_g1_i1.p1 TRINITY_DN6643_c2_g1~~TRINITY_DN6643_c2_g1_i1.p1  ORF type:complete len:140 (+),score=53.99 TRINITY_DN6643_c2_g1_i1:68-487(+)
MPAEPAADAAAAAVPDPLNEAGADHIDFSKRPQPPSLSVYDKLPAWHRFTAALQAPENREVYRVFLMHSVALLVLPVAAFYIAADVLVSQKGWKHDDALTGAAFSALGASLLVSGSFVVHACLEEARDKREAAKRKKET